VNSQEQFEYQLLIDRISEMSMEFDRCLRELGQQKTRVENELDRFMALVYRVFGEHPDFAEIVDYGYYDDWTGAANV